MAPRLTPPRRGVAAALLFLACAALAGVALVPTGVEYRVPGLPEAVLALYLSWLLADRGVWSRPRGVAGWLAVAYGTAATAQLLHLLLPPPGVLQLLVAPAVAVVALAAVAVRSRRRLLALLASLAFLLAVLDHSVVPHLWGSLGPAAGTAFGLGDTAESARRLLVDYRPLRPGGELPGAAALCAWVLATLLAWPGAADLAERRSELREALRDVLDD